MSPRTREAGPLYGQVAAGIEEGIRAGKWAPGAKLPSERELCELFRVSQITVRRALRDLAQQSRVYSRHGLGWYVESDEGQRAEPAACDMAVIAPAHDGFLTGIVTACVEAFARAGRVVEMIRLPKEEGEVAWSQAVPEEVPLLWAVAGEERSLAQRYGALTAPYASRSLLLGRSIPGIALPTIAIDEQDAMARVTGHLISAGHRRIGYVGSDPTLTGGWRRYQGYRSRMLDGALELPLAWVVSTDRVGHLAEERISEALAGNLRPTAVVCSSDTLAAQTIHHLGSMGLACPSDVAVTGFGDEPFAAYLAEPLTTFRFDLDGLATQAQEAVMEMQGGRIPRLRPVTGDLVVRTSCGSLVSRIYSGDSGAF
ncbi:MAG: GntR family transcriptional regulator [Chloroflexi bacterium]|nr:GntR family transcriptional regulator [Chloroflexota bacterium]